MHIQQEQAQQQSLDQQNIETDQMIAAAKTPLMQPPTEQ